MPAGIQTGDEPGDRAATVIANDLRRRIIRGELAEGELLAGGEQQLLTEFGVSRPTVREAIRILESESLLVVRRGSRGGIEVSVPRTETAAGYAGLLFQYRQSTLADIFQAAAAIEGPCAAMLAKFRTSSDLGALHGAVAAEREAVDDAPRLLELQNGFHRLVVELVGNATLKVLSDMVRHMIEVATQRYLSNPALRNEDRLPASETGIRAHAKLVGLIEKKDAVKAEALWRRQIVATGDHVRRLGGIDSVIDLLD